MGAAAAKKKMMNEMADIFRAVQKEYQLPFGDFPDLNKFKEQVGEAVWAAMSQAQQPQQSVVPVTIDVVKQLTVYYQAWKENRISEEQLQQLNDMPIDANTGLVWWQWIERQNGIWAHWPPRAKPAFMQDAA